jgi:AraC-like DNA-binding protein
MKNQVVNVEYSDIRDYLNLEKISNLIISDDVSAPIQGINRASFYPIRLPVNVIILCKKGSLKLKIGLEEYVVVENSIAIIFSQHIFQIMEISPDFDAGYILLASKFFDIQHDFITAINLGNIFSKNPVCQLSQEEMQEMLQIFDLVKNKIDKGNHVYLNQIVQYYFRILFYNVCHILNNTQQTKTKTHKEEILELFIKELQKHFKEEHSVQFYAGKLCLTPKYMASIIFQASGKHPSDWIKDYIILEAKALLKSTTMTIQQISDELNFVTQSHFGKYFKHHTGYSPKDYRKIRE